KSPSLVPVSELAEVLPTLNRISSWIESVFAFLSGEAINHGMAVPGYKVVEGRSRRIFSDTKAVIDAAVVGDVDTVLNNGSVLEGITPHDGTTNEASYKITTKNGYEYDKTTNTVTVMPDTTWVEVGKEWMVRDKPADSWPEGAEVVVALTRNGEVVEGKTVTLTADSPTGAFMDLPRLIGVTYGVQEVSCSDPHYVLGKAQETEEGSGIFVITNTFAPDQPEVEKYVNNDVHADLVEFDRVFKYDILAYVTEDAKTMAIRDQLVPSLEFADGTLGAGVAAVASDDPAKVVTAVVVKDANDHKVGGTVAQPGTDVSASAAVAIKDNTLDVVFDDAKAAGIQGKWVQVTFWAKYTDAIIKAAEIGDVKKVVDNGAVLDGAAEHEGTFNGATYHIVAENDFDYGVTPTNEVTVVPETVTIPVKKVWKDYDGADLAWPSGVESIKVNVLGKDNAVADTITLTAAKPEGKSKVLPKLIGVEYKLEEATQIEGFETTFDGNTIINVKKDDRVDYSITKKWVGAKTSELPTPEQFKGFLILKDGDKDVTKDFAANLEVVDNGDFTYTATWSKLPAGGIYSAEESAIQGYTTTVEDSTIINTKTREEKPEIEKYINQDVHQLISLDDTFTYDIIAWVTKDADVVVIEDELDSVLAFAGAASDVVVTDLGERDNHNTNGDFTGKNENATVAAEGKTVNADVAIVGKRLTAAIADATPHRGHWVRVSFQAKVAEGKTLADVQKAYKEIKANAEEKRDPANVGNAPVLSTKDHEGVPNNAKYSIYLKHAKLDESGKPVRDESGNEITELDEKPTYGDESNTVTVRPVEEFEVLISKTDLGGTEVEGARIKVTDADGNVIDEWTSAADAHKFNLKPGRYTMVEVVAPEGFQQVTTEMVFEVDDRGNVTLITTEVDGEGALTVEGNHINLADAPEKVKTFPIKITKADIASGNELPGAHIQILDKDGNIVAEWDSTDTAHELQLEAGDYTMVEVNAPEGYKAVETRIQFSVNADGSVTVKNAEEVVDGKIEVKDVNHLVLSDMAETTLSAEASVVTKVWNDGGNAKDRKPVTFQLYYLVEGGTWTAMPGEQYTVTINEPDANGVWSTSFGDLPARVDGKDVQYKAVEANQTDFVGLYDMGEGDEEIVIVGTGNDNHGMSATNNPVFTGNYEVLISKRVLNTTTELEGATLQVLDASGQLVEGGEWVTDGKQKAFQLPVGLYTLHEKAAPKGYKLAADVQFRINANGTLEVCEDAQNDKWANVETGNPVVMYDAPEESENPNPVPNNQNPNTEKKAGASAVPRQAAAASTTPRATTTSSTLAKTSDDLGMVALALGAVTALALAAGAYSMRRRRSDV
ncbi:MAG: Cna B-type domain-containing protein, partial [Eggerthellaceae bacterium]|nr:Cna B-type domain-containing protein [Eggerthellaceae bacterium]